MNAAMPAAAAAIEMPTARRGARAEAGADDSGFETALRRTAKEPDRASPAGDAADDMADDVEADAPDPQPAAPRPAPRLDIMFTAAFRSGPESRDGLLPAAPEALSPISGPDGGPASIVVASKPIVSDVTAPIPPDNVSADTDAPAAEPEYVSDPRPILEGLPPTPESDVRTVQPSPADPARPSATAGPVEADTGEILALEPGSGGRPPVEADAARSQPVDARPAEREPVEHAPPGGREIGSVLPGPVAAPADDPAEDRTEAPAEETVEAREIEPFVSVVAAVPDAVPAPLAKPAPVSTVRRDDADRIVDPDDDDPADEPRSAAPGADGARPDRPAQPDRSPIPREPAPTPRATAAQEPASDARTEPLPEAGDRQAAAAEPAEPAARVTIIQQPAPAPMPAPMVSPAVLAVVDAIAADPAWSAQLLNPATDSIVEADAAGMPGDLEIQLRPVELGTVTARLRLDGATMRIEIEVETVEAFQRLSADREAIERSLKAIGIEAAEITIHQAPSRDGAGAVAGRDGQTFTPADQGNGRAAQRGGEDGGRQQQGGNWTSPDEQTASPASAAEREATRRGVYI